MKGPLTRLGDMPVEVFLAKYWQKKPLIIRNALPDFSSPLTAQELAGLALESFIESRIISHTDAAPWQLQCGPFSEADFESLPAHNWTLLVQAVDHWVPEISELLDQFRFIPNWRIDDVMASYAPKGGSVGPHFDQYDVFLLQGAGTRQWQIGPACDEHSLLRDDTSLQILKRFESVETHVLTPGDILYLPPGIAHWGIAQDDECITYSIGFRAPSHAEILREVSDDIACNLKASQRFCDPQAKPVNNPGLINTATVQELKSILVQHLSDQSIAHWFGRAMSEPKYVAEPDSELSHEEFSNKDFLLWVNRQEDIQKSLASRFCYYPGDDKQNCLLFVDGKCYSCQQTLAELLCRHSTYSLDELAKYDPKGDTLLRLINAGSLLLDSEHQTWE